MNKEYYIDSNNLVLLKQENNLLYQYSFTKHFWYSLPELQGLEQTDLVTQITEKEANDFINYVNSLIKNAKKENQNKFNLSTFLNSNSKCILGIFSME